MKPEKVPPVTDKRPIQLRAFVESESKSTRRRRSFSSSSQPASEWSLVFDTETTVDASQALRVGFCRVYQGNELKRHILFYDLDVLSCQDVRIAEAYARAKRIELMSREEFIEAVFYKYGYKLRAMIIGFNLPFDLSRLARAHAPARGAMRGGFSLKLSPHNYHPPIQVRHLSRFVSMIRFAAPFRSQSNRSQLKHGKKVSPMRGFFTEMRALAVALFSRSFTLESLADHLGVSHPKLATNYHGKPLTLEYLAYADRDVLTTWECYQELSRRYEGLELRSTPVHLIFSEASIGKASFVEMGIQPWLNVQKDIPRRLLAQIMSAYFGGRSEVRIRRELRQVVLCDFLSMYPTVCRLLGLWRFVTAQGMCWRDGTEEVRRILETWKLVDLQVQANWQKLVALVQVQADANIFPVRAQYDGGADGTIGANYLSSDKPLCFTLADCLASQLLTGKPVKVLQAVTFEAGPPQSNLKSVSIGGSREYVVNPYEHDFYKRTIEARQRVKERRDAAGKRSEEWKRLDVEQNALKIMANATSYGIFAEINVNDRAKKEGTRVHAATSPSWVIEHIKDEMPGTYFHPLLATTITGAARLMLAIAEHLVTDEGLEWAFCDTDSIAIAKPEKMSQDEFYKRVDRIVAWFSALNPYEFPGSILKIEDVNFHREGSKARRPLFVWAVSAKRYALFNIENGGPVIRKASAHGLGHLRAPYEEKNPVQGIPNPPVDELKKIGVERWHHDLWWTIANAAISGNSDKVKFDFHPTLKQPAASRYAATTPKYLRWFDEYNEGRPYSQKVKPFGFVLSFSAGSFAEMPGKAKRSENPELRPVAPFDKNPAVAAKNAFDRISDSPVPVESLKTYQQALAQYHLHPEDKFLNGDYLDQGTTQRRHVFATEIQYIGKESNKWEEQFYFGFDLEEEMRYGARPATKKSILKALRKLVEAVGQREAAQELRISRTKLSGLLENGFSGRSSEFSQRICGIVVRANSRQDREKKKHSELLILARREIRKTPIAELSRRLNCDPANFAKMIRGERVLSDAVRQQLQAYFADLTKAV